MAAPPPGRTRPVGAEAVWGGVGITLFKGDVLCRDADLRGKDLREGRGVALTLRNRAQACDRRTGRMDPDFTAVEHAETKDIAVLDRARTDDFGEVAEADAKKRACLATLESLDALRLFLAKVVVTDSLQGLVPTGMIVAGIIFPAESRLVRELVLLDEVLGPELPRPCRA